MKTLKIGWMKRWKSQKSRKESLLTLKLIFWIKKSETSRRNFLNKFAFLNLHAFFLWVDTREICDVGNKIFHWIDNQLNKLSLNMKIRKKERKKTFLLFCRTMAENSHLFAFNPSQRMICCRFDVFLFFSLSLPVLPTAPLPKKRRKKVWKLILNWNFGNLISLVTCNALVEDFPLKRNERKV